MSLILDDETVVELVRQYQRETGAGCTTDAIKDALVRGLDALRDEALMAEKFGLSSPVHKLGAVIFMDRFR